MSNTAMITTIVSLSVSRAFVLSSTPSPLPRITYILDHLFIYTTLFSQVNHIFPFFLELSFFALNCISYKSFPGFYFVYRTFLDMY